jgi:hypothetical protein
MAQRIELYLDSSAARRLQSLAREWSGDSGLGMSQGCHVLLDAVDSGEFVPKPKTKKEQKKEEPEE